MRFRVPVESSFSLHPWCRRFGYSYEISDVQFSIACSIQRVDLKADHGFGLQCLAETGDVCVSGLEKSPASHEVRVQSLDVKE